MIMVPSRLPEFRRGKRAARFGIIGTILTGAVVVWAVNIVLMLTASSSRGESSPEPRSPPLTTVSQPHPPYKRMVNLVDPSERYQNGRSKIVELGGREITPTYDEVHSLSGSKDYDAVRRASYGDDGDGCVPMREWQTAQYPACGNLHEIDMARPDAMSYVNDGSQTIVFELHQDDASSWSSSSTTADAPGRQPPPRLVLKMPRWKKAYFTEKFYEERRIDAVILERLTSSPYVASIHGFCASSVLAPYSAGDLHDLIAMIREGSAEKLSYLDRLKVGAQVASGLAALHDVDGDGRPSFSHDDLDISQHVYDRREGTFRLNDFNYGKILLVDPRNGNRTCTARSRMSGWKYRSPEELRSIYDTGEGIRLDVADVYSMGNELYMILTNMWLFEGESRKRSCRRIIEGGRPPLPPDDDVTPGGEGVDREASRAMRRAISMCWVHDPEERATAGEVASFLRGEVRRLEGGGGEEGDGGDGVIRVKLPTLKVGVRSDYDASM